MHETIVFIRYCLFIFSCNQIFEINKRPKKAFMHSHVAHSNSAVLTKFPK